MKLIGINNFVKRQTKESEFTNFTGGWEELVDLTTEQFNDGNYSKGYRDGVVIVHMKPFKCFLFWTYTGFKMYEGMKLKAEYRRVYGREHESPIIVITPAESKIFCRYVDVILYRADVLEEDNDRSTGADWEIVSINGRIDKESPPMDPMTIVRNWKHLPGGTEMKDSDPSEVLETLCQAIMFKNGFLPENKEVDERLEESAEYKRKLRNELFLSQKNLRYKKWEK